MSQATQEQVLDSVIALCQSILATEAGLIGHKRSLLSACVWPATELNGKYNLRYWSEGVYTLVQQHGSIENARRFQQIIHEHVNTRKALVDAMLRDPSSVEAILREQAIACLVTKDEHRRLSGRQAGFDRYRAAGIRVWDMIDENWFISE